MDGGITEAWKKEKNQEQIDYQSMFLFLRRGFLNNAFH